jgi:predicted dehydrogenase
MAPIVVALIGGGLFAKQAHMPAITKANNLDLKAIYSRSLKSAKETGDLDTRETGAGPALYSADSGSGKSLDDLLARDDIDAVIIALPIPSQPEYIQAALAAGKHVLAEKPIAPSVADANKLIEYYHGLQGKATFSIAENFRYKPCFEYAASEAAKLGALQHFSVRVFFFMGEDSKWYGTSWRAKPQFQGGFLLDGGVHFVAAMRQLLDEPAADVSAFTSQVQPHLAPVDTVNAVVRLKSGVSGTYQQSCGTKMSTSVFQFGYEKGSVVVDGDNVTVTPWEGEQIVKDFERTRRLRPGRMRPSSLLGRFGIRKVSRRPLGPGRY